eukprot:TRINITY_DN44_c1_g1_i2.p1 TRINITY_DN44_c1_g1~~TRINITY_DN44_c1_g1_i2.p1  ORF type:complete len:621 (-),score=160.79 TRINITY_DN44_c1_g1_i2:184-2046(-)
MGLISSLVRFCRLLYRDIWAVFTLVTWAIKLKRNAKISGNTYDNWWSRRVRLTPDREFLIFADETDPSRKGPFTYAQVDQLANRAANFLLSQGVRQDDVIAIMLENSLDFVVCQLGAVKIGANVALVNTSLPPTSLTHTLRLAKAKLVLFHPVFTQPILASKGLLQDVVPEGGWWCVGSKVDGTRELVVGPHPDTPVPEGLRAHKNPRDIFGYIYTSGTTGLPKAAVVKHLKLWTFANLFSHVLRLNDDARMYCPLPMFHSNGNWNLVVAVINGFTFITRKKFSASNFIKDVVEHRADTVNYIGEIIRYINATPPSPLDRQHKLKRMWGNGLRVDVSKAFIKRFGVTEILEGYTATEANGGWVNFFFEPGAIGFCGYFLRKIIMSPSRIIKYDVANDEIVRGPDGFCVNVQAGEAGEAIFVICADGKSEPKLPSQRFEGYTDTGATNKKVLRDVFVKGDSWFRTGDLLFFDQDANLFFADRVGDTFRWKGENVATNEVADILSKFPGIAEVNVYGVSVPGAEGRAGMAAFVPSDKNIDLKAFHDYAVKELPPYAVPVFIRLTEHMPVTTTFKHVKVEFVQNGFNPALVHDPIFVRDSTLKKYVPVDGQLFARIASAEFGF